MAKQTKPEIEVTRFEQHPNDMADGKRKIYFSAEADVPEGVVLRTRQLWDAFEALVKDPQYHR